MNDQPETNNTGGTGKMLGILALGAIAGVITGILVAPKSGEDTRKDIADLVEKIKHDIGEQLANLSDFTSETYHGVVNTVVGKYQATKEITDDEAGKLKAELGKNFEAVKKTVTESANDTKDRLKDI